MKRLIPVVLLFLLFLKANHVFAGIRLPSVIGSNMVLQQKSDAQIWGWADPAERIVVTRSWDNGVDTVVTPGSGRWSVRLKTPAAGGPYTITLKGRNTIVLENIMIGEVWVCSGQSNMEWSSYQGLKQIIDELPNANNPQIRLFQVSRTTSETPQDNCTGQWNVCSSETLKGFSGIAYFFAKKLSQELNVPVGVINASWGGTPAEPWTPGDLVEADQQLKEYAAKIETRPWWPVNGGAAYNAMIYPLTQLSIAGVLWYQGEGNVSTAPNYQRIFSTLIKGWRRAWQKEFPFYYVQIAPYKYGKKYEGAIVQEQQTKTLSVPRTGMVVVTDLVDDVNNIHPKDKISVAHRLANLALAEKYGKDIPHYRSPLFRKMDIEKGKAVLYFDHAPNGFMVKGGGKPTEFLIAGADKVFVPADVKIEKDRIIVSSKQVKEPAAVRFGFSNTAMANLFSKEGLPVTPFRTDEWELDVSPE